MKKTLVILSFFLFLIGKIHAQNAQNLELGFTKPSKLLTTQKLHLWKYGSKGAGTITTNELTISLKKPEPFIAFSMAIEGLRIDAHLVEMSILTKQDGAWSKEWLPVKHNHDADNSATRMVTNMCELDKNTTSIRIRWNIKSNDIRLKKAKIRFFAPGNISTGSIDNILTTRAACAQPPSVSRAVWGAQWSLSDNKIYKGEPSFSTVTHLIVHHSAGNNTSVNWAAIVASYFDTHVNVNGWSDIGYNYLIAPDGTLFVGRGGGSNVIGAHMCGYNTNTMGVCLIGDFTTVEPSQKALETLQKLLAWKASESNIDPLGSGAIRSYAGTMKTISGHKDGCAPNYTECPGDLLYPKLPTVRQNVKTALNSCLTSQQDELAFDTFKMYPNPNNGQFDILLEAHEPLTNHLFINVLNAQGQIVFEKKIPQNMTEMNEKIELKNAAKGFYILHITDGKKYLKRTFIVL